MSKSDNAKHTPGPWKVMGGMVVIEGEAGRLTDVADCCTGAASVKDPFTIAANARLIAAAPELLEACENARNVLAALVTGDLKTIKPDSAALAELRAAIAKAKGDSSK
jgi:hypothetical protein